MTKHDFLALTQQYRAKLKGRGWTEPDKPEVYIGYGGADDVVVYPEDGAIDVLTSPESFAEVRQVMESAGLAPELAEVTMRADNDIAVDGETAQQVVKLLRWLEDMDDVQNVYSNAELGNGAGV